LAFKPKTNDMREAPSVTIIEALLARGAKIVVFDPKAMESAKEIFGKQINYAENAYGAIKEADCLVILTEWNEFRRPDFDKVNELLKTPLIFDGRNLYDKKRLKAKGIEYFSVGKK